ncbi:hypothetical protein GP486_008473 [Trichoglossum hirsutum]|uniref:CCHC-type domain-containing protein n=1 Tax=Trichoglossum hirsutum TaxID=265104 RepID=A0A9P8I370_9PEZI|nr:hypothetical protein GP486_008473 [Trichoglossum hirsutum]
MEIDTVGEKKRPRSWGKQKKGEGEGTTSTEKKKFKCFACGKPGHYKRDCRNPKQKKGKQEVVGMMRQGATVNDPRDRLARAIADAANAGGIQESLLQAQQRSLEVVEAAAHTQTLRYQQVLTSIRDNWSELPRNFQAEILGHLETDPAEQERRSESPPGYEPRAGSRAVEVELPPIQPTSQASASTATVQETSSPMAEDPETFLDDPSSGECPIIKHFTLPGHVCFDERCVTHPGRTARLPRRARDLRCADSPEKDTWRNCYEDTCMRHARPKYRYCWFPRNGECQFANERQCTNHECIKHMPGKWERQDWPGMTTEEVEVLEDRASDRCQGLRWMWCANRHGCTHLAKKLMAGYTPVHRWSTTSLAAALSENVRAAQEDQS